MDTLSNSRKLKSMNNGYKTQFLQDVIINLFLIFFICSFLSSYSNFWFSLFKQVVFFDTSYYYYYSSFIHSPKCLFLVVNIIVLFLLGESKLIGNSNYSSSSSNPIYDEYVERIKTHKGFPSKFQEKMENSKFEKRVFINHIVQDEKLKEEAIKEEEKEEEYEEVEQEMLQEDQEVEESNENQEEIVEEDEEEEEIDKEIGDGEEESGLWPAEELNKRVEEFIARVNKQRWIEESRLLVYYAA